MILYHGTTLRIEQPRIIQSEIGRDFGFAFYTERALATLTFVDSYIVER